MQMKKTITGLIFSILLAFLLSNSVYAVDYDYMVSCVSKGTCSCGNFGQVCSNSDDCVEGSCAVNACPDPPKPHSSFVESTCTPTYDHSCICELAEVGGQQKEICGFRGSCSCASQGACFYKCDSGYEYDDGECISSAPVSHLPSEERYCCQSEPGSNQYRCYLTGCCCEWGTENEYWYQECPCPDVPPTSSTTSSTTSTTIPGEGDPTFKFWVEGPTSFTVGEKIPITFYLQNLDAATGDYTITYTINSDKDYLIDVGIENNVLKNVEKKEIKTGEARIIVYEASVEGTITFTATSEVTGGSNWEDIVLGGSEMQMSLPEFGFVGVIILISLASLIYLKL